MKNNVLLLCLFFYTISLNGEENKKIILTGNLNPPNKRSPITEQPVTAYIISSELVLSFWGDYGFVEVILYDGCGAQFYYRVINTKNSSGISMNLDEMQTGNCRVVLSNRDGVMWGDFLW